MHIEFTFDDEHIEKLEFLKRENKLSTDEVLQQAIDTLYELRHKAARQDDETTDD